MLRILVTGMLKLIFNVSQECTRIIEKYTSGAIQHIGMSHQKIKGLVGIMCLLDITVSCKSKKRDVVSKSSAKSE